MPDLDQLGSFYLGRRHDLAAGKTLAEPVLYDSTDLTTHAVCVGMTGSGKTGLCLALLEEAALDGVPAIAIDCLIEREQVFCKSFGGRFFSACGH